MSLLFTYVALLAIHYIADFVVQTDWQATYKSKRMDALGYHVGSYTLVLASGTLFMFHSFFDWAMFLLVNAILHLFTDYCTSRISSRMFAEKQYHNFFVVVGADQLIHQVTLAGTLALCMGLVNA